MLRGILQRIRKIAQRKALILMYHQVCEKQYDPWELAVQPDYFHDHLEFLKKNFEVVPVSALAEAIALNKLKKTIAITFDDGFGDNYWNAAPLLNLHELPATFYVATTAMKSRHMYWWDSLQNIIFCSDDLPEHFEMTIGGNRVRFTFKSDRFLTGKVIDQLRSWSYSLPVANERVSLYMHLWSNIKPLTYTQQNTIMDQIRDWAQYRECSSNPAITMSVREMQILADNPLFSIGAHSVHHSMLAQQHQEDQAFEVRESKRQIERWLGRPVNGFAYPYGNFNSVTQALLKDAGFAYAVSTEQKAATAQDDPFALPRMQVKNWCVHEFAAKLNEMVA